MPTKEREIYERLEGYISTLARLSRATGINLFLGVQRPDANVLTGQIKITFLYVYADVLQINQHQRLY